MDPTADNSGISAPDQMGAIEKAVESTLDRRASWIVRASIANPYAVIVLSLFIVVIGLVCLFGEKPIPVDLLPAYKTPALHVLTLYPGMPADILERDITKRFARR